MRRSITILFYIFLFLISGFGISNAQEIKLKSAIERDSIWLGDQIKLIIVAEQPVGTTIQFPQVPDSLASKIEILNRSRIDTAKIDAGHFQMKQTFVITCFDSGQHVIPPFKFNIKSGLLNDTLKSNSLTLFVKVPNVNLKLGPADIKKPFGAPVIFKEIAPWVLGAILAAAILFLIIYAVSRVRKNKPLFQRPEKPKLPPDVTALQELDRLKNEQLWQRDKVKEYYTRLTDIIRVYIEERFDIPAMEQTTFEILNDFKGKSLLGDHSFKTLKDMLEIADLVKFAKFSPLPDDNHLSLSNAYNFVRDTRIEERVELAKSEGVKNENELLVESGEKKEVSGHE